MKKKVVLKCFAFLHQSTEINAAGVLQSNYSLKWNTLSQMTIPNQNFWIFLVYSLPILVTSFGVPYPK